MSSLAASLISCVNFTKSPSLSIYGVLTYKVVMMKPTQKMKRDEIHENAQHTAGHKVNAS